MHSKLRIQKLAIASAALVAIAGCGGGSDNTADPGTGPVMVNAFAYVQPIVASGASETAEPQDVNQVVLSSTETEEPDSRL
jgi:ABC-type glycerol-3-phosphate transport system substrate-binding protein